MASLVWGCCRLIGAMPHWLRYYVLQDTIYFIVYKCLRYRVGVVTENLRNSFPDRPMAEIKRIRRSFYCRRSSSRRSARPPCRTTIAAAACG